ncbi:MAG TPA: peroxiredoxin [Thermoanaerobaculaceae bacterium]|nr:peroxiredoxin [Thermoanaerobaculaceae bacterium]
MKLVALLLASLGLAASAAAEGMLKTGDAFPAWQLTDQNGAKASSADFAGKTYLLWFFPKAMTPGCTKEGCTLRDNYAGFQKAGVEVVGVSFDDPKSNAEFIKEQHFPFRLLSDTTKALAVAVGAADSPGRLWARRISYLVGPDGKVLKAYPDVDPAKHAGEVLADIASLKIAK